MLSNTTFLIRHNYSRHLKQKFAEIFFWQGKSMALLAMKKLAHKG